MLTSRVSAVTKSASSSRRNFSATSGTLRSHIVAAGRRTPLSLSLNQSFRSSPHHASQILDEAVQYSAVGFGAPLPVLVTEALTLQDRSSSDITVKLDPSGWAWVVVGRRLFIWKYKQDKGQRLIVSPRCQELTLPASDVAHKAELVCVFQLDHSPMPHAIAVSPEGAVRYWRSITQEGAFVEISVELHGQECYSLTNVQPLGWVLATTTGTLVLISPLGDARQNVLTCRTLRSSQGLLAGLGRRVSTLIFGSTPHQSTELHILRVLVSDEDMPEDRSLIVLGGTSLQKWALPYVGHEQQLYECDLHWMCREKFVSALLGSDSSHASELKTWLIDMQLDSNKLVILTSASNSAHSSTIHFACGVLDVSANSAPTSFALFMMLNYTETYVDPGDEAFVNYRLLLPDSDTVFIYHNKMIICVPLFGSGYDEVDKVKLRHPRDRILGAGSCDGLPLFFTQKHGIVCLNRSFPEDGSLVMNSSVQYDQPSMSETLNISVSAAHLEALSTSQDPVSQFRAAFLLFCKQNMVQSQALVEELFPPEDVLSSARPEVDSTLDHAVISLSQQLIDDYPAADPRWAETVPQEAAFTTSLIILQQLDDKLKAHKLLIAFVKQLGLWSQLRRVTVRSSSMSTRLLLLEHEEKLIAAKALRNLQISHGVIVEAAIKRVLKSRKVTPTGKLSHQDMFYREVSKIEDIFPALLEYEEEMLTTDSTPQAQYAILTALNSVFLGMLPQACKFRSEKKAEFQVRVGYDGDVVPWTAVSHATGVRTLLIKQYEMTIKYVSSIGIDVSARNSLYQQAVDLADLILDGRRAQIQALQQAETMSAEFESSVQQYEQERHAIINPLLESKQYEKAAALAEKYLVFDALLRLCETFDNQERLEKYMLLFEEQGFRQFAYKWYMKEGKLGKLLSLPALQKEGDLRGFLQQHHGLSWLMDIRTGHFNLAQKTLWDLGKAESGLLSKRKTFVSLSKLCALASDETADTKDAKINEIIQEQDLILYQETLPAAVLEACGLSPENMRVLTPVELIELYISEHNVQANEFDFKKGLDLLHFVPKENYESLRLHIWCRAILCDNWDEDSLDMDNPLESGSNTIFFKTVELAFTQGLNLQEVLPTVSELLGAEELGPLHESSAFRFILQAGYEHISKVTR